jgi:hypothetical protein
MPLGPVLQNTIGLLRNWLGGPVLRPVQTLLLRGRAFSVAAPARSLEVTAGERSLELVVAGRGMPLDVPVRSLLFEVREP